MVIINLMKNNLSPFIMGGVDTGKTSISNMVFNTIKYKKYQPFNANLSYEYPVNYYKGSGMHFEKCINTLYPPCNKKSLCYVDDLNLPKKINLALKQISPQFPRLSANTKQLLLHL